jgi:hypothetical protein
MGAKVRYADGKTNGIPLTKKSFCFFKLLNQDAIFGLKKNGWKLNDMVLKEIIIWTITHLTN